MSSFLRWRTRDGRNVLVSDMDDAQLLNTFAYAREKFRELAGIDWFPGISGHRNTAIRIVNFLDAFYSECQKRKLNWKDGEVREAVDTLFVPAADAMKLAAPASFRATPSGSKFSLDLDDGETE